MVTGYFVTNLGQEPLKHIFFFHRTECFNAQLFEKWSKQGRKELTFLLHEELAVKLEKHLHLIKLWENVCTLWDL